jgi:RNA polymerase sigma-70 factor (ECF subfamily)
VLQDKPNKTLNLVDSLWARLPSPASQLLVISTLAATSPVLARIPAPNPQDRSSNLCVWRARRVESQLIRLAQVLRVLNDRLERLFREHSSELFVSALAVTGHAERAEDAVQEAFYRLFRLEKSPRHLKAYVFRAVRNAAVDQLRKRQPGGLDFSDSLFDPADGPGKTAAENELKRSVAEAICSLSDAQRETVINHLYAGLTFREIALARQLPVNTVKSWYRRGIEKLERLLEKHNEPV